MSVVGLDFGNANNVVALARRKGIDVVLNTESKRETPSMVNFGVKQVRAPARVDRRRSDLQSSRVPSKAFFGRRRARTRAWPPAVIETHAVVQGFLRSARVARRRSGERGAPRAGWDAGRAEREAAIETVAPSSDRESKRCADA